MHPLTLTVFFGKMNSPGSNESKNPMFHFTTLGTLVVTSQQVFVSNNLLLPSGRILILLPNSSLPE